MAAGLFKPARAEFHEELDSWRTIDDFCHAAEHLEFMTLHIDFDDVHAAISNRGEFIQPYALYLELMTA